MYPPLNNHPQDIKLYSDNSGILEIPLRPKFLYLPFMHSESKIIHEHALKLFENLGNPINLEFEQKHKAIIDRFGRYPHRNEILGRTSTAEEIEFLKQPGHHF